MCIYNIFYIIYIHYTYYYAIPFYVDESKTTKASFLLIILNKEIYVLHTYL